MKPRMRASGEPATGMRGGLLSRVKMRPGKAILLVALLTVSGSILINAAFLQSDKHPAPFFARKIKPVEPKRVAVARARPAEAALPGSERLQTNHWQIDAPALPPVRVVLPSVAEPRPIEPRPLNVPPVDRRAPQPLETSRMDRGARPPQNTGPQGPARDLIGSLLKGGLENVPRPPAQIPDKRDAASVQDRRSTTALQAALVKLGYKLDIDGIAGPATRTALERFQRANNLEPTGRAERNTMRLLAAQARVNIPD